MIALVLDLETVLGPRIFPKELAVGANSLDVVLVGLKMDPFLLLLLLIPSVAVPATPGTRPTGGFNIFVVPELIRKLGCRDWDVLPLAAIPSVNALLDAEELARTGAKLFLLAGGASKGRDAAVREGFF
jgi:hypothetical protein